MKDFTGAIGDLCVVQLFQPVKIFRDEHTNGPNLKQKVALDLWNHVSLQAEILQNISATSACQV